MDSLVTAIFENAITARSRWHHLSEQCHLDLRGLLESRGYLTQDGQRFQNGQHRVFVDLVDDITSIAPLETLTTQDLLLTDTQISRPVNARVINVPRSWMGVFGHEPDIYEFDQLRSYSLLTNRIDTNRMRVLLATVRRRHLHDGIINFNCVLPHNWPQHNAEIGQANWRATWHELPSDVQARYHVEYSHITSKMPYKNHDLTHDQALQASAFNMIVETFSGDDSIRFSEKTFAALVLPRPWAVFAGRWATTCLRRWGFDVLDDLINHDHERHGYADFKHEAYVKACVGSFQDIQPMLPRLRSAASRNRDLLLGWRKHWQQDFQNWLDLVDQSVKI